jgi:hypothetical protein
MQAAHQEQQNFEEALKQVLAALSDKQEGEQTKGATVEQDANDVPNRAIRNSCAGPIDSLGFTGITSSSLLYNSTLLRFLSLLVVSIAATHVGCILFDDYFIFYFYCGFYLVILVQPHILTASASFFITCIMGKERVMSDGQQHSQATIAKQGFLLSQIE